MQEKMPVVDMLERWAGRSRHRLHMPGHKGGRGLDNAPGFDALRFDATELADTDDLFAPAGALKERWAGRGEGFSRSGRGSDRGGYGRRPRDAALARTGGGRRCGARLPPVGGGGVELAGLGPVFVYPETLEDSLPGCVRPDRVETR